MIAFAMIVLDELVDRSPERCFTDENHPVQAGFLDRPYEALRVRVEIRGLCVDGAKPRCTVPIFILPMPISRSRCTQLAMNSRRSPQRIRRGYLTDDVVDLAGDGWTANRSGCRPSGSPAASQSRCHRTTVSGRTRTTAERQFLQMRCNALQNSRSRPWRWRRLALRLIAISCCRRARFSRSQFSISAEPQRQRATDDNKTAPACRDRGWRGR